MRDLLDIMWQRHSCRAAFDAERKIREEDLLRILDAARWAPTAHNMQNFEILVVDDAQRLAEISRLRLTPSETFEVDRYQQLSFSDAESLHTKRGLLASMFPASWHERDAEWRGAKHHTYLSRSIPPCAALLLVVYELRLGLSPDALCLMSLGCVMQNLWLMGESLGISIQILTAVSEAEVQTHLRRILAVPGHMSIAFAARLGYPVAATESHLRVRRRIQDFTHRNQYVERKSE